MNVAVIVTGSIGKTDRMIATTCKFRLGYFEMPMRRIDGITANSSKVGYGVKLLESNDGFPDFNGRIVFRQASLLEGSCV